MGEQFCNSGKESSSWFQQWRLFYTEEALNLPGSKGPEWGVGERTILHQKHWGNTWKIPWNDPIHHGGFQQRLLDGGATPQVQETDDYGFGHWKVPVDKTSNGFHHCTGCIPMQAWCNFPQCARGDWDSWWHDCFWKNWSRTWWKSPKLSGSVQEEQLDPQPRQDAVQTSKIFFFGHTWSDKGLSANPKKIEAVKRMEIPQDVETMRSFLGLINYLNCFSPRLADLSEPLREICRQKVEFQLAPACEIAFQCCKEEILQPQVSNHSTDRCIEKRTWSCTTTISTPVMFASRALTGNEKNYQNLEWECLATIWGMEKFHYFLYGKEFTLETDQKPLVSIYKKHMVEISPRIQRIVWEAFYTSPSMSGTGKEWKFHWQMLWVGLPLYPWKKMEYSYPLLQLTRWQQIFHTVPMIWSKSMKRQGRILHSSFWYTTFQMDGLVIKGSFHKSSTCTELQGRSLCQEWDCNQGFQTSHAFHTLKESLEANTWRSPRSGKVHAEGKGVSVLARDQWWHPEGSGKVWNLPINFQSFQACRKH